MEQFFNVYLMKPCLKQINITAYNWKARKHKHVAVKELKDSEGKQKKRQRERKLFLLFLEAMQS